MIQKEGITDLEAQEDRSCKRCVHNNDGYGDAECMLCDVILDDRWSDKEIDQLDEMMREDGEGFVTKSMREKLRKGM